MYASFLYSNNKVRIKSALLLVVPLVLAAFTHLWNPIGFPSIYVDEAHYMRRTLNVLEGSGPQESKEFFHHPYDHPYFGQLFLASILGAVGYPDLISLPESGNSDRSIEMLYTVPRILMGVLSILDTFVLFKIAECRYDRKIACIAAILFAVMPLGWFIRRVWLESIQLPFLLLSILLVVRRQAKGTTENDGNNQNEKISILIILISGVFLGLGIFTKIPVFAMIPLVGYLVYTNNHRNLKLLGIWFIPILSIVLIWPAYAIYLGDFGDWFADVFWQTSRSGEGDTVSEVILDLFKIDPILLVLGAAGLIVSIVKRDLFLFLWMLPYLIFSYVVVHSSYWYFIPLLPAFCMGAARLIAIVANIMPKKKKTQQILSFGMISAIGMFGLISTTMLITTNVTSAYFKAAEFVTQSLSNNGDNKILVTGGVGLAVYTWIPMNILDQGHDFRMLHILFSGIPTTVSPLTETIDAMFIVDRLLNNTMTALINIPNDYELDSLMQIFRVYNSTRTIATFTGNTYTYDTEIYPYFDTETYPYYTMKFNNQLTPSGPDRIEVRTNFDSVSR